jgi:ABC-type transport system involved in multi-copper enzyme maturation permease subunit
MILLPILGRELRVRAQGRATYLIRCGIGLVGMLICIEGLGAGAKVAPALAGQNVFSAMVMAAFLISCSCSLLTADAISREKREGTLGLLFLTRVKAVDVLVGKLGSIGMAGVWSLLAFLPVLMVPVLVGGVTGGDAFRKALALVDTLFLALAAGLWASAGPEDRFTASRRALLLMALLALLPVVPFVLMPRLLHGLGLLSPLVLLLLAGDIRYSATPRLYWLSLILVQFIGWLLVFLAGAQLRKALRGHGATPGFAPPPAAKKTERSLGLASWQPVKEEASPIEWVVYRLNGINAIVWIIAVLGLACNGWTNLVRQPSLPSGTTSFWLFAPAVGVISGFVGSTLVAWVASRFFVGARRSGVLELLLTTPLGAENVLPEQRKVLRRIFVWPVLVMQAPIIPQLLEGLTPATTSGQVPHLEAMLTLSRLVGLANTYLGIEALCWLGLWFGMKAGSQGGAIIWTVGLAKGLPSVVSLVGWVIGAALGDFFNGATRVTFFAGAFLPEVINLFFYLLLIQLARRWLPFELSGIESKPILPTLVVPKASLSIN